MLECQNAFTVVNREKLLLFGVFFEAIKPDLFLVLTIFTYFLLFFYIQIILILNSARDLNAIENRGVMKLNLCCRK